MAKLKGLDISDACRDGADYFNRFSSPQEFVEKCERGDWLLWLFARTSPDKIRLITLVKGICANTVRHLMLDETIIAAVDAAIAFGKGLISTKQLAAYAAAAAAANPANDGYAANTAYAAYAAYTDAANAAYAAAAYAYADAAYANAAYAYADAACAAAANAANAANAHAYTDAADAARIKNQQETADICRRYLPIEMWNLSQVEQGECK